VDIPEIHVAMEAVFQRMRVNLENEVDEAGNKVWPNNLPKRA